MSLFNCPTCNKPYNECICNKEPIAVITTDITDKIENASYTAEDKISIPVEKKSRYNTKAEVKKLESKIEDLTAILKSLQLTIERNSEFELETRKMIEENQKITLPSASFVKLNDIQIETAYEALNRVIRQLSGNRSIDYKKKAIPLRDFLQKILKEKRIIQ